MLIAPTLLSGSQHPPKTCSQILRFSAESLSCERKKKSRRQILVSVYFLKATKRCFYRSHMNFIPTQSPPEHRLGYRQRAVLLSNPPKAHQHSLGINIYPPPSLKKKALLWNLKWDLSSLSFVQLKQYCSLFPINVTG